MLWVITQNEKSLMNVKEVPFRENTLKVLSAEVSLTNGVNP